MGQIGDALVTAGLVLFNVVVGVFQEGRAKRKLEKIALLTRPKVTVIRNWQENTIDPSEIVLGDVLLARAGDQIAADGQVTGEGQMEVDESLLTGESELIPKKAGDPVYSGSFCVTGTTYYEAQKVGTDSFANQLIAGARAFRQIKTPLKREIDLIIRILVIMVTPLGILLAISFVIRNIPVVESVRMAAVIVALVPQGLFFMTTIAYAMGVVRVANKGALIQQINAVESTSHVNLLCLDKTGTLTTNRIKLHEMWPVGNTLEGNKVKLSRILGDYATNMPDGNRTIEAIKEVLKGQPYHVEEKVSFSSEHKWSALSFNDVTFHGTYVLGAPEVINPYLQSNADLNSKIDVWTNDGLRVLLFAYHPENRSLHNVDGKPQLPSGLIPLSLVSFSDELRPEAKEIFRHFTELGIQPKIISGDNTQTVAALYRQVGLSDDVRVISGLDLDAIEQEQLEKVVEETTIFGRITPLQKEKLVRLFRSKGYYVAMIGDGVNDVLALKQAHVGIAMQSGSQATKSVADMVLLGDSFAAVPIAFREGQRIIKAMEDIVRLLLTRTFYVMLLVIATQLVGVAFPITPRHNSILALLTVGIPTLAIAAWARPGTSPRSIIRSTSRFVFPAALTISLVSLAIYLSYLGTTNDVEIARTALTTTMVLCGLVLIPFVEPPTEAWVGGDVLSGDWRPTALALGMLVLYGTIIAIPPLRTFFELIPLHGLDYLLITGVVIAWALLLRIIWRARLFERLIGLGLVKRH